MEAEPCLNTRRGKIVITKTYLPKQKSRIRMDGPDGGWAWIVAFSACLINFIIAGLGRMSGILYVAFIDLFNVDRKGASAPFSVRSSTRNLLGPVVGILGQKYGVRPVTITGGIVGTISAAMCFYAEDITWITILWGGINGVGTALTMTLPQVVVGQYFDRHKTTAAGMAFSGGCVGAFLFPVLLEFLLHNYGLSGTFLIMGGIIMHVIPAAMILKRPPWLNRNGNEVADVEQAGLGDSSEDLNEQKKSVEKSYSVNSTPVEYTETPKLPKRRLNSNQDVDFKFLRKNKELVYQILNLEDKHPAVSSGGNESLKCYHNCILRELENMVHNELTPKNGSISEWQPRFPNILFSSPEQPLTKTAGNIRRNPFQWNKGTPTKINCLYSSENLNNVFYSPQLIRVCNGEPFKPRSRSCNIPSDDQDVWSSSPERLKSTKSQNSFFSSPRATEFSSPESKNDSSQDQSDAANITMSTQLNDSTVLYAADDSMAADTVGENVESRLEDSQNSDASKIQFDLNFSAASTDSSKRLLIQKLSELHDKNDNQIFSVMANQNTPEAPKVLLELRKAYRLCTGGAMNDSFTFKAQVASTPKNADKPRKKSKPEMPPSNNSFYEHIKTAIRLHRNLLFLLICLSRAVHFVTFVPAVMVLVDFGRDKGLLEEDGKYIIAALSLGDLLGRLFLGWLTDRGYISLQKYMLIVMLIQGASTASLPMMHSKMTLLPTIALFGMLQGSLFIRHPVLVQKYLGDNEQSIAMGCINFLSGFLGFGLPAFIGYFRDTLHSYDYMFYLTGIIGSAVGTLWLLEPYFVRCMDRRQADNEASLEDDVCVVRL